MVAISGRGWRLAPCLVELFKEADARKPNRSHASDGSIGDAAHSARASDHNPADGWVTAGDLDDDHDSPDLGVRLLRHHLVASQDPRVKYLIHEGTVWKSRTGFKPEVYTGPNAHAKHLHVSVHNTVAARNNTGPWWPEEDEDMPLNDADKQWLEAMVDRKLKVWDDKQNTWIRTQLGIAKGETLYDKIRTNIDVARDGLAKLIRGE